MVFLLAKMLLGFEVIEFSYYEKSKVVGKSYLVSEKFDGVRGVWDGQVLRTKRGNVIVAPKCWSENLPPFSLDGELWIGYEKFEAIQSISTRENTTCKEWENVRYKVFDMPECMDSKALSCTRIERLAYLQNYLNLHPSAVIEIIPQELFDFTQEDSFIRLDSLLATIAQKGGEGLILRPSDELDYKAGRAKNAFKLKPYADAECKIVGYTKGKGKFTNKVGALICEQEINVNGDTSVFTNLCKGRESCTLSLHIGSGLNDVMRENPPKIGTLITYQYNGFTKNSLPRFPRFLRIYQEAIPFDVSPSRE